MISLARHRATTTNMETRRDPLARVVRMPTPAEWADDDPMTLREAAAVFWPDGPFTVAEALDRFENTNPSRAPQELERPCLA